MPNLKRTVGIILLAVVGIFTYSTFNRPIEKGSRSSDLAAAGVRTESAMREHVAHQHVGDVNQQAGDSDDYADLAPQFEEDESNVTMEYTTVNPTTRIEPDPDACRPHQNVAFIKVHRSGSTTVQNIFLRYGYDHGLVVGLPRMPESPWIGCRSIIRDDDVMPLPADVKWNIFAHHSTYNKTNFERFMHPDTRFVGIIRKPINRLRSVFYALQLERYFPGMEGKENDTGLMKYLRDPGHWNKVFDHPATCFEHDACVKDCMAKDLGLPPGDHDGAAIDTFYHKLGHDFSLVMIMEYFNHSLVLLKRRMCWKMQDILYIPADDDFTDYEEEDHMTEGMLTKYKRSSEIDYYLYEHFNASFWRQILLEGQQDFLYEVREFERILGIVKEGCTANPPKYTEIKATDFSREIDLDWKLCTKLKLDRLGWDQNIRGLQNVNYGNVAAQRR